jgi:deoxyribose-phosphate aldolase
VARTIDHALLKPELTVDDVLAGCAVAADAGVATVCCRPADVERCRLALAGSGVGVSTVIGFPHGAHLTATKVFEAQQAIEQGAVELDMVLAIGPLRGGQLDVVQGDIAAVVAAAGDAAIVKVILENAYLTDEQKVTACRLAEDAGAAYVKTSTGFAAGVATLDDVRLMRASVSPAIKVKASGGIRTRTELLAFLDAGADRIGTSSTAAILAEL